MAYSFDSRIRYSEVGEDRKLTIPQFIDYFQDCSTFHSEDLGVGLEFVGERHRAWVINYWHIEFNRRPRLGEKVRICTVPYEFRRFFGKRNFWMEDEEGNMLACADSLWTLLDTESGRPARVEEDIEEIYGKGEPLPMEDLPRKIAVPEGSEKMEAFSIVRSHLDTNHHVNNAQYIYMAQQYLPEDVKIKRLRVEYKMQAVLNDVIYPFVAVQEDLITISLCNEMEKPYAVLEFKIDKEQ